MLSDFENQLKRLRNYERVLLRVIKDSKQALLDMHLICSFLEICAKRDYSKVSFDEVLRTEVQIDQRRFWRLINSDYYLYPEERDNLHLFVMTNSAVLND